MNTATEQLLDLSAKACATNDPGLLLRYLQAGHPHWCAGLAEVRADVTARCSGLQDAEIAAWCDRAGALREPDMPREQAVAYLAFAVWDASPAAIAYTELVDHAAELGVSLIPE